jgi:8-oxo-dGTP pyrophosphatase MutT (NUDIX family)
MLGNVPDDDATGATTDDGPVGTDPAALAAREGVERVERTYEHDDPDHPETGHDGRVVLGIARDREGGREVLVLRHREHPVVTLPNGLVEEGAGHVASAVEFAREALGLDIEPCGVERVRFVEHLVDGEPDGTTAHVVLAPTVADGQLDVHDDDWTGEWTAELPEDGRGDTLADMRLFLDR